MLRGPGLDAQGALHHVMVRGLEARDVFLQEPAKRWRNREVSGRLCGRSQIRAFGSRRDEGTEGVKSECFAEVREGGKIAYRPSAGRRTNQENNGTTSRFLRP
jgi:hypothetical protein